MIGERERGLTASELLDSCDGLLGEIGRRGHLFAWLRPPGSASDGWLVVDAYYPRHRLVVICRDQPREHDALYAELVPQHGLKLLELRSGGIGEDRERARRELAERIRSLALPPPPSHQPPASELEHRRERRPLAAPIAQAAASLAQPPVVRARPHRVGPSEAAAVARATRFASASSAPRPASYAAPRPASPTALRAALQPPRAPQALGARPRPAKRAPVRVRRRSEDVTAGGLLVGLALVAALVIETYLDVALVAMTAGLILLSFGIAIDACARALGTVAAKRDGQNGWAWACVLCGCPAVARFALFGKDGPVQADPAAFAGLLSLLAAATIMLALLLAVL